MSSIDIMRAVWYKDETDLEKLARLGNYSPEQITDSEME